MERSEVVMEQASRLLNNGNQLVKSSGSITTLQRSNESSEMPQWVLRLAQMAQDKRHDLAPGILRYWREKLEDCQDTEVCEAINLYTGEFFPSVDEILSLIERRRQVKAIEKQNAKWDEWKANQAQAEAEGKLATQEQYDELREVFRKVAFGPPLVSMKGAKHGSVGNGAVFKPSEVAGNQEATPVATG